MTSIEKLLEHIINNVELKEADINDDFIKECKEEFHQDPSNIIARNSIVSIGSRLSTTSSTRLNDINHIFMNTIKKRNTKATNQGRSGRCWMFSGLNIFRHNVVNALEIPNFEFSETYLFFWDKFERSNTYLSWFVENPDIKPEDDEFKFLNDDFTGDGGWWNMFVNLVEKYGVVPKTSMKETFQSGDSEDMNKIIIDRLQACANAILKSNKSKEEKNEMKNETMKQVFSILVKFLGEPPEEFEWSYVKDDGVSEIVGGLTPIKFKELVMPGLSLDEFIVLTNLPGNLNLRQMYEIEYTSNTKEGVNFTFLNLPMYELNKYATNSVLSGLPVWFAADVSQDFHPYHSTLDDKLVDEELVFGSKHKFTKGDKITFHNLQANHAMSIVGLNVKSTGVTDSWQVENSWGYWDNETPGEDGFLYMSDSWFNDNVMQIVVHKSMLTRTLTKLSEETPIKLKPWNCVAPATRIKPQRPPEIYNKLGYR